MTRPGPRRQPSAAAVAAMSGAVDLSALKERAQAAQQPPQPSAGGAAPSAGEGSAAVVDVTEATFEADVLQRSTEMLVVVDLWATWCGPCKQLSPVLEKLAAEGGGSWILAKVDVDANPRIAQAFGVQSVPTVVAIAGGRPVDAFAGAQPEPQIREWLQEVQQAVADQLPGRPSAETAEEPPEDPRVTAAEDLLDRGDLDGAAAQYQQILDAEPGNTDAAAALRQVRFLGRAQGLDERSVETADSAPTDVDAQLAAADFELFSQRPEAAFDRLIETVKRTAGDDRTAARTRLLELFELFEPSVPFVAEARKKLARALF